MYLYLIVSYLNQITVRLNDKQKLLRSHSFTFSRSALAPDPVALSYFVFWKELLFRFAARGHSPWYSYSEGPEGDFVHLEVSWRAAAFREQRQAAQGKRQQQRQRLQKQDLQEEGMSSYIGRRHNKSVKHWNGSKRELLRELNFHWLFEWQIIKWPMRSMEKVSEMGLLIFLMLRIVEQAFSRSE